MSYPCKSIQVNPKPNEILKPAIDRNMIQHQDKIMLSSTSNHQSPNAKYISSSHQKKKNQQTWAKLGRGVHFGSLKLLGVRKQSNSMIEPS